MRDTGSTRYGIGIPSRGRTDKLIETLEAIFNQTLQPSLIVVIDNNEGLDIDLKSVLAHTQAPSNVSMIIKAGDSNNLSDAFGSQKALNIFTAFGYGYAVKWDDDLVPELDCMEKLIGLLHQQGCVAAGGMYPKEPADKAESFSRLVGDKPISTNDDMASHLQFYHWQGEPKIISLPCLYSSFAYNVHKANIIGGFAKCYSQHSYGHETDFTLRLAQLGKLCVDTSAVAIHGWCEGGVRIFDEKKSLKLRTKDFDTFTKRMNSFGIDSKAWRYINGQVET